LKAKTHRKFKIGDRVKVIGNPPDLDDSAGIDTPGVFKRSLGRTFSIRRFGKYGHAELEVTKRDTIWIEPQFLSPAKIKRTKPNAAGRIVKRGKLKVWSGEVPATPIEDAVEQSRHYGR
jgi:hypothetical protein